MSRFVADQGLPPRDNPYTKVEVVTPEVGGALIPKNGGKNFTKKVPPPPTYVKLIDLLTQHCVAIGNAAEMGDEDASQIVALFKVVRAASNENLSPSVDLCLTAVQRWVSVQDIPY